MTKNIYLGTLFLLMVLAAGCKSLKIASLPFARTMPSAFPDSRDTASAASMSWRSFFEDRQLVDLIDTALANNWDMLIAIQRVHMYQADALLNKGAMKPYVKAVGATGVMKFGDYTMDGAGNATTPIYDGRMVPKDLQTYQLGLQASWEVDVWGRLKNKKRAAFYRFLSGAEGRNLVITNLISDVATAYYELAALDNQLDIINETITLQENALDIVKVQKEAAMTNELGVEQFEAQLLGLKGMRFETQQQIMETESRINMLLGRYPQSVLRNKTMFAGPLPARIRTGIPYALLQNRPDIRQAEAELVAARADVKAAKAAFYPSLSITGGVGYSAFLPGLLFAMPQSLAYNVLGSLAAPLINRSALQAEFDKANAQQLEALYNYQRAMTRGYTEVYVQVARIGNMQRVYDLKRDQVSTLTRSITTSSELFKTGRSNYLEVLITQQNALRARLEMVSARKDVFSSTVALYRALGGGWQ